MTPRRAVLAATLAALVVGVVATAAWLRLRRDVSQALESPAVEARPLSRQALAPPDRALPTWTGGDTRAVVFARGRLVTGGDEGVRDVEGRDLGGALPTRRVSALATWSGDLVVGLDAGGLFLNEEGRWVELRSGWGTLHVRALHEAAGGVLLVAAREGLFRAATGAVSLERLSRASSRAVATAPGLVLAGGEEGLARVTAGPPIRLEAPDPWIESIAIEGDVVTVLTAAGLTRGPRDGPLVAVRGSEAVARGVARDGLFWGAVDPPVSAVRVLDASGVVRDETLPAPVRDVLSAGPALFADTDEGLYARSEDGWGLVRPRRRVLPPGPSHVTALARHRGRLVAGLFDGGLAVADDGSDGLEWRSVPGSAAWGVNALLPAGGELFVASLRGAARFDGERLRRLEGTGAAFSLASTPDGVAIGYGGGVLLPGSTLLSAFHGLPGNQALALAHDDVLFVGTPSGLGALDGRRVLWRVTSGEGKLPHPWVTALQPAREGLYVGTWGGGLARRSPSPRDPSTRTREDSATWEPFVETDGIEVSPGALALGAGLVWAGTDAHGLWRLRPDRQAFERLDLPLPSPRVTALLAEDDALWIGTDQGVTRLPLGVE